MAVVGVTIRLASRGSPLARAQTAAAGAVLSRDGAHWEIVVVKTTGDRQASTPAQELPGQGWFTADVEEAVAAGLADVAVHSAKDLPSQLGTSMILAGLLPRGDPRDALVSAPSVSLMSLDAGARIGTSSPRRTALVRALRPDLTVVPLRGNVDSRIARLDAGDVDAVILACAGIERLGMEARISERLDPTVFIPAPAQGVIAMETRAGTEWETRCRAVDDSASRAATVAERAVLAGLGGGCSLPLGAWASVDGNELHVRAALAVDGTLRRGEIRGAMSAAHELGLDLAARLQ